MKQSLVSNVVIQPQVPWQRLLAGFELTGRGGAGLLDAPLTAFFASRQCTGWAIRMALEWALRQASSHTPVISGFQSPLERSVLDLLLEAGSPVVVVLARPIAHARLPRAWSTALDHQHLAVISVVSKARQLDQEAATNRNEIVARLARNITIAHAAPGGRLEAQVQMWSSNGKAVNILDASG